MSDRSFAIGTRHKVLCADGVTRVAVISNYPDTFFSVPARVKVKGKTVTGYVYASGSVLDEEAPVHFSPNGWMRNAVMLPRWPERCHSCHGRGQVLPADYYDTVNRYGQDYSQDLIPCVECGGTGMKVYPRQEEATK